MREDAFRAYAAAVLSEPTADSYVAYVSRVERVIEGDVDQFTLDEAGVAAVAATLSASGIGKSSVANCKSALRLYGRFRAGQPVASAKSTRVEPPLAVASPRSPVVREASIGGLLRLYGDVLDELRERGVARTGNGPIGDYAERLFAQAFGWELSDNSTAGHDAERDGGRYQIKARRLARPNSSRQLGVLRDLPGRHFDMLAAVLLDARFNIQRAALIPFKIVTQRATWTRHVNGYRFMLADQVWSLPGVRDVTSSLAAAAAMLDERAS